MRDGSRSGFPVRVRLGPVGIHRSRLRAGFPMAAEQETIGVPARTLRRAWPLRRRFGLGQRSLPVFELIGFDAVTEGLGRPMVDRFRDVLVGAIRRVDGRNCVIADLPAPSHAMLVSRLDDREATVPAGKVVRDDDEATSAVEASSRVAITCSLHERNGRFLCSPTAAPKLINVR